jgi:hypothetical protein
MAKQRGGAGSALHLSNGIDRSAVLGEAVRSVRRIGEWYPANRRVAAVWSPRAGVAVRTLGPYLELPETLFLVHRLPAWSTNLSQRLVSRPKVALYDTGLAAG